AGGPPEARPCGFRAGSRHAQESQGPDEDLRQVVDEAPDKEEPCEEENPLDPEAVAKAAQELITCRDVLARFGRAIEADGLVEETDNAKLLYLALASRLFDWRVSVVLKGVSAGGKSVTVEKTLAFFPTAAYYARTGLSDHALIFEDEEFRHRHIVIYEAAGMDSERLSYFIRTLLSER